MKIRLSSRLIFGVVLIEIVMLSILVWNSVRLISSSHAQRMAYQVDQNAKLLANNLAPGLAATDRAVLLDVLSLLHKDTFVYVGVYDNDKKLLAKSGNVPKSKKVDFNFEQAKNDGIYDSEASIVLAGQALGKVKIGVSLEEIEKLIAATRFQNTSIAFIEIILSITVTFLLAMVVTRHLRKLEEGAAALARGELNHRIDINSTDEIGDLARGFNKLARNLSFTQAELKKEHIALERKTQHLQTLIDGVDATIIEADLQYCSIQYVSREAESLLGFSQDEWLKPGFFQQHTHPDDFRRMIALVEDNHERQDSFCHDVRMFRSDGSTVWVRNISTVVRQNERVLCRGLILDISEQKKNEERIIFLAEHDSLTGLFNRHRFQLELERSLDYAERFKQSAALMFIDLDQFKYINDTLGHQTGDEYLCLVAQRLVKGLRKVDILGRLGGDEFGVILPNTTIEQAATAATHLLKHLATTNAKLGGCPGISASIGVVIFPDDGDSPNELLAMADAAMYRAKDLGRNRYHIYETGDESLSDMQSKLHWEQKIRDALANDQFELHYQPIYNLGNMQISHYEVLLRMKEKDGSLISPGVFIDIAERFGLIAEIDHWVIRNAIMAQSQFIQEGLSNKFTINLSGRHFGSLKILDWIRSCFKEFDADPSNIVFEVTETAAVENIEQAITFTENLHELGCAIALDDFGIGFSSFHYLKHLHIDIVKLDGSFIRSLVDDDFDRVFVKSMSDMARALGIVTVAEFVENEAIVSVLQDLHIDMGQGFHLGRPAPHLKSLNGK
ncbi:MAG: EAL domain-containing protein [Gammaproteobacteria bacterium]|nr:EAL domain-containing protein [Gammaproteobacteria bacterium]